MGKVNAMKPMTFWTRTLVLNILVISVIGFLHWLISSYLNPYYLEILLSVGVNVILAVSLNLINGQTGQFSLGHAGFMAIGAYASASVTVYGENFLTNFFMNFFHLPLFIAQSLIFVCALGFGAFLSALAGFLVGLPVLRLRGDYLAIATLGFGEIIRVLILNMDFLGGARGLTGIADYTNFFWVGLCVYMTLVVICNIIRSTKGRAFLAIREDEVAAEAMGINTTKYKVGAFVIGAFFAGIAGGLLAHQIHYLHTNSFTFMRSIEIVVMVVLGGMGSVLGCVIAAIVLTILPEFLRFLSQYRMVIYSLILILLMLMRSTNLWERLKTKLFLKVRSRRPEAGN